MEKEDLVKNMHFKLKMLNIGTSGIGGFDVNYKNLQKQQKPEWPRILKLATMSPMVLDFKKCGLNWKDTETIAFMLAENPEGASQIHSLQLQQNKLGKEGAKFLAPALKTNTCLSYLNLD